MTVYDTFMYHIYGGSSLTIIHRNTRAVPAGTAIHAQCQIPVQCQMTPRYSASCHRNSCTVSDDATIPVLVDICKTMHECDWLNKSFFNNE